MFDSILRTWGVSRRESWVALTDVSVTVTGHAHLVHKSSERLLLFCPYEYLYEGKGMVSD